MSHRIKSPILSGPATLLVYVALLLGLTACANTGGGDNVESLGGTMLLEPGGTGLCRAPPCKVQFRMPPGQGSYEVLANEMSIGSFPAGETVSLGEFWNGQTFVVKGAKVAPAYFNVQ